MQSALRATSQTRTSTRGGWASRCAPPRHAAAQRPGGAGGRSAAVASALRARWLLDARYGCKGEVTSLLVEWVQTVGAEAGVDPSSARISSGSIGTPESRLELEVSLGSMADWDAFLARIPAAQHRAWSQRVQGLVVDGSPRWEVYRTVDVPAASPAAPGAAAASATASAAAAAAPGSPWSSAGRGGGASSSAGSSSGGDSGRLVFADKISPEDAALWDRAQKDAASSGGGSDSDTGRGPAAGEEDVSGDAGDAGAGGGDVMLDWKGDPIQWSPGDKVPFKFL